MGGNAYFAHAGHQKFRDAIAQHPFARNNLGFTVALRGGVVFKILHERASFWPLEQNFAFAFIDAATSLRNSHAQGI